MVNSVEHLVQQGLVIRRAGQWTLRDGAAATMAHVPEALQQLLRRRIEALLPETRQVLEVASVVGREFAVAAVAAGVQCPVEDVEARCEELAAQQHFLVDIGLREWPDATSSGRYRFAHVLYRQVLYEGLGTARRRQLHRCIGVRLEAGYGAQAGKIAAHLAVHFERGGEIQRAVHYGQARQPETGLRVLAEAATLMATTDGRWWEAERFRLQGQLLLHLPHPDVPQAEACFRQALAVARAQQARALELRAAISLSRLWQQQGQPSAACQLLMPIYRWFTEGFATPDLHEAKVLCEVLSSA